MDGLAQAFAREEWLGDAPGGGILYIEDFDAPAPKPAVPDIIAPAFTQEDIDTAHREGYEAGSTAALADHTALHTQLRTAALASIGDALATSHSHAREAAQAMAGELAATLLALLAAALPATAAANATTEINALLATLLPPLMREPALSLRVHPTLLADITATLHAHFPSFVPRLAIEADAHLTPPDIRLSWEQGAAAHDTAQLWNDLRAALAPYNLPPLTALLKDIQDGQ
jgi:flagellar biosynthesis/type III secretory pathway protein FliH